MKSEPCPNDSASCLPHQSATRADAVIAFAERFAQGRLRRINTRRFSDAPCAAAERPCGGHSIRDPGEPLTDAVIRAVMDLDRSYLFIQGRRTGKTFNAAHAIIALLRAGKRVGVSSNSHKAINKLLSEWRSTRKRGLPFPRAKKATRRSRDRIQQHQHQHIFSSDDAGRSTGGGGTVFHFCREDQRELMTICSSMKRTGIARQSRRMGHRREHRPRRRSNAASTAGAGRASRRNRLFQP